MKCANCGTLLPDGAEECVECGMAVCEAVTAEEEPDDRIITEENRRSLILFGIIFTLFCAAAAGICFWFGIKGFLY